MKKLYVRWASLSLVALGIIALACCNSCSYVNEKVGLEDDHAGEQLLESLIEQAGEKLIKEATGEDIDLPPIDLTD